MNILYINPLTDNITFLIIRPDTIVEKSLPKSHDNAATFPQFLVDTVRQFDIGEIWVVAGPGQFTLMRIVTLSINSIAHADGIPVKSCHFFDLIAAPHTPILSINPAEYLIRDAGQDIEVAKKNLPPGTYAGLFGKIDFTGDASFIQYEDNASMIREVFDAILPAKNVTPLYCKPPKITWASTTMPHSWSQTKR